MNAKDYNNAIDQYADNIFRFVLKHTRNKMLADDIVQETFAKVWEKHEDIQVEKAKSYLFTTAYHCLVDVMKKEARSGTLEGIERQGTQDNAHLFDIQKVLQEALDRLPEIQKTVVLLRDYEGYHYDEIAEITEFFLIARQEGLLSNEQSAQLNHWLEANAHYQQDARLYALTTFEADETVVYEGKADLKKPVGGRVIPMWFTGLAVAAGLALIFTIGLNQSESNQGKPTTSESIAKTEQHSGKQADHGRDKGDKIIKVKNSNGKQTPVDQQQSPNSKKVKGPQPNSPKRPVYQRSILHEGTVLASLEKRQARLSGGNDKTISPLVIPQTIKVAPETLPNHDVAVVSVDEMKNPIKPVTTRLSETFNTPVDLRTAKAAKKKGGGFYFKFGKLEVSHQTASLKNPEKHHSKNLTT